MAKIPRPTASAKKPKKPHKDFPLTPHPSGRWCKKVRGKLHYFGTWGDPQAALAKWLEQKDDLLAGRTPRVQGNGITVQDAVNKFLNAKRHLLDNGELSPRTFRDYHAVCGRIVAAFGLSRRLSDLASDDFEHLRKQMARTLGPVALGCEINRARVVFKFCYDSGLLDRPMRYGQGFRRPSAKTLRKERHAKGSRMFEAHEIRAMLDAATQPLKAMILLGINCGFGNSDVGNLPLSALDLDGGWVDYPRPKTGIPRRCPLWPETTAAIREAIGCRPAPKDDAARNLVFVTCRGGSWFKTSIDDNPVAKETVKLLKALGIKRPNLAFYGLRRTFATIAGESRDQPAVDAIMGHSRPDDMPGLYREMISDERLRAVAETVRTWLFGKVSK
jgi:integrase